MMRELLVVGKLVHPGNSGEIVNSLGSQIRKAGLDGLTDSTAYYALC
jgi:hypothetical protein